jgi:hypothetical protein
MPSGSPSEPPAFWDIRQDLVEGSRAGLAVLAETTPAYVLSLALTAQPEFWQHVAAIRSGEHTPSSLAPTYLRRRHGRRLELLERYLQIAADAESDNEAKMRLWNIVPVSYSVEGVPAPDAPQRALRADARWTLSVGALRVARRGASRCVAHDCGFCDCADHNCHQRACHVHRPGAPHVNGDYCAACSSKLRRPREAEEAERSLFDGAIAVVLGGSHVPPGDAPPRRV